MLVFKYLGYRFFIGSIYRNIGKCGINSSLTISGRNNALIFNFSIFSGERVNLVGEIGRFKFPVVSKNSGKKINKKKTGIST